YNPSIVQAYAPGGATILGNWALSSGVKVNGLALDGNGDFFVTDTNNGGQVEEYHYGTLTPGSINSTVSLLRTWGDPHSEHEFLDYIPASIALVGNAVFPTTISAIVVGDVDNDLLQVFQGP
ncbi:MAG: hypothetical protein ACREL1_02485, partial [bacterium]